MIRAKRSPMIQRIEAREPITRLEIATLILDGISFAAIVLVVLFL